MGEYATIGCLVGLVLVGWWVVGLFHRRPKADQQGPPARPDDEEPELTDDELALLLGRAELKRAREKLVARAGLGRSRGPIRGPIADDTDEEELSN